MPCNSQVKPRSRSGKKAEPTVTKTVRLDAATSEAVTEVFDELGLSFSAGVTLFLKTVARTHRIPFDLEV